MKTTLCVVTLLLAATTAACTVNPVAGLGSAVPTPTPVTASSPQQQGNGQATGDVPCVTKKPEIRESDFRGSSDMSQATLTGLEQRAIVKLASRCPCQRVVIHSIYGNPSQQDANRFAVEANYDCGQQKGIHWVSSLELTISSREREERRP